MKQMIYRSAQGMHHVDSPSCDAGLNLPTLSLSAYGTDLMFAVSAPSATGKTVHASSIILSIADAELLIATIRAEIAIAQSRKAKVAK